MILKKIDKYHLSRATASEPATQANKKASAQDKLRTYHW